MKTGFKRATAPLALFMLAASLSACEESNGGSNSKKVTVWMYPVIADPKAGAAYWDGIEKAFEKAQPGTSLTIEQQPWENRDQKIATAFGGGKGPDVVLLTPDQIPQFSASGAIGPVDGALKESIGKFLPATTDAMKQNGRIYGAPIYQTVTTTIYNKRLLAAAGITTPPATWDEIKAAAPKLKQNGVALLDYSASNEASLNLNFYPLLWQAGGSVFQKDGKKVAFNAPEGVEALTFLTDLYKAGSVPKSSMTNTNLLADQALGKQQAAMGYSVVLSDADLAAKTWGPENVLVGGPLRGPAKEVAFGIPGALSVNAKSKNTAGAENFLAFMTQPQQIKSLGRASGYFSPRTDVTVPSESPYAKQYQAALANVFPGEPNPAARQLMGLLAPEVQAALTGKKSPKEALDAAAKAADDLLARRR
ncbi:sugar ABC transporter substrate-binding protein [Streptomyces lunaelactis]|uniref:ABC transporter substrate-binding protein n=1 Tax=Streptomyces lunaelactis TaxID=1535768 RepID=UPI001585B78E|nr:sugar ABC transporter substrate-binding protein [Streptomyces lunaelactis]NUK12888.1 sugar ABC transporter substrate-binding protein [Streptomyces lunaelactis]NUK39142.1 sugar ABC transporter substrate-binding protein [Streptomyces lunaelactis]NUK46283.1 sugar ABC transporter substrate-binding protein [Streptomyces lunaelactis]NUK50542.1 sugar ABC transporter substrate-binding protein [Streptomyces lunaelactis]NUK62298.1 sugar ABC transporter substrate-binding protein [Streptomyces lunaelac